MLPCVLSHDDQLASSELRLQFPAGDDNGRTLDLLEPERGMARNLQHIAATKEWTIGLIAVQSFLDNLRPASAATHEIWLSDMKDLKSLPSRAKSLAEIYKPLVSANVFGVYSTCKRAIIASCSQQENILEGLILEHSGT